MKIIEHSDRASWNQFLFSQSSQTGIFLQSWDWGEFQKAVGRKVYRYQAGDKQAQVIELALPFGKKYWYIPRGSLIEGLEVEAKNHGALFVRVEPLQDLRSAFPVLRSTQSIQPKQTLVLDLSKSTEEILQGMHEKTRYNIRLADRKGVKVKTGQFEEFWKLLKKTSRRDQFFTHPQRYYKKMLEVLGKDGLMKVRLHVAYLSADKAGLEAKPLAAAMVGYFGDTATYLHGASAYEDRALMAPYALHWDIIKDAKKDGYLFYDFWGIDGERWPGVTRFKLGFGGQVVEYPGAFDLPFSKLWYTVYRLGRRLQFSRIWCMILS